MQMTRHRVRPSVHIDNSEKCPSCAGTGKISNALATGDLIEQHIEYLFKHQHLPSLSIWLHPYLYAYFTKGIFSKKFRWWLKYKRSVEIREDAALGVTEFRFHNHKGEAIHLA